MSQSLLAFIQHYRQPLLYVYAALLLVTAAMLARAIWHWAVERRYPAGRGTQMNTRYALPTGVAVPAGLFVLLLSLPFFIEYLGRFAVVWKENPALIPFYLLFPAMGLLLLLYGLRGWWQQRVTRESLRFNEVFLRPGGLVSGYFRTNQRGDGQPVHVHLVLQQTRLLGPRWNHPRLFEEALWSDSLTIHPRQRGDGVEIPFLFRLPRQLPGFERSDGQLEWVLVREGGGLPSDIRLVESGESSLSAWKALLRAPQPGHGTTSLTATAMARRGQRNLIAEIASLAFVTVFPWMIWFLIDSNRQPWLHLDQQLPPVLLAGLYFLVPFFTAVFALLRWAMDNEEEKRRWQRRMWLAVAGDFMLLAGALFWLARNGMPMPEQGWFEAGFSFLTETMPRSIIGAFLWISLITPLASIRYYWMQGKANNA